MNSYDDSARVFKNKKTGEEVTVWITEYGTYHCDKGNYFPENKQMEDNIIKAMNKIIHCDDYFVVFYNPTLNKVWLTLGDGGLPDDELGKQEPEWSKYTTWNQMEEIFKNAGLDVRVEAEHDPSWDSAMEFLNRPNEYHYKEHMTYFGYYHIPKAKGKHIELDY